MNSNDTTKKRKVDSDESGISLAAVLAEMQEMKSKLSRMNELESRCINMQNEIDSMKKDRISRMGDMQTTIDNQQSHIDSLESKGIHLEDRCDSLQRSVEILSKESTWEYSAPAIPNSHWTSLGFNEEYVQDMESVVATIRYKTCRMRNGECIQYITFGEESQEDAAGILLQHDNVLLPHWKEFATAFQLSYDKNTELKIQNMQLIPAVMVLLIPALKGKLKTLFLDNNDLVGVAASS